MTDDAPASTASFTFSAEVVAWDGPTAWYFLLLPEPVSDEIADLVEGRPRSGFGAVRVEVSIGGTTWRTSVFPDKRHATYLLPVKKAVRVAEGLDDGTRTDVRLSVLD